MAVLQKGKKVLDKFSILNVKTKFNDRIIQAKDMMIELNHLSKYVTVLQSGKTLDTFFLLKKSLFQKWIEAKILAKRDRFIILANI